MYLPDPLAGFNHNAANLLRRASSALLLGLLIVGGTPERATASTPHNRFEQLRSQDLRVQTVAYRLSVANAARCDRILAPQPGFVLHGVAQYAPSDRADIARAFGLDDAPGVMAVVIGSPAERAGLRAGDRLRAVNGHAFEAATPADVATSAGVERARQLLIAEMHGGPLVLSVSGPDGDRELRFTAELGCPSNVELIPGEAVNAWADGSRVMISSGLLQRCATDGDLALVIAHEMAHNLLHHRDLLAAEGIGASHLLPLTEAGSHEVRMTEEAADRLAVSLATAAGFDLTDAASFLGGLLGGEEALATTHPAPARRLALLRIAIADARQDRAT